MPRVRVRRWLLIPATAGVALSVLTDFCFSARMPSIRATERPVAATSEPLGRFVGGTDPIADDKDPKRTRCSYDPAVITIDRVEVNTLDEHYLGEAEIRYSPRCRGRMGPLHSQRGNGLSEESNGIDRGEAARDRNTRNALYDAFRRPSRLRQHPHGNTGLRAHLGDCHGIDRRRHSDDRLPALNRAQVRRSAGTRRGRPGALRREAVGHAGRRRARVGLAIRVGLIEP